MLLKQQIKNVFIAGAFTEAYKSGKSFDKKTKERLQYIISCVNDTGCKLFSSHNREAWGEQLEKPAVLSGRDIEEMSQCTHVVVYLGKIVSIGAYIEIGLALALKKPILIIKDSDFQMNSDFLKGLIELRLINEMMWNDEVAVMHRIHSFLS